MWGMSLSRTLVQARGDPPCMALKDDDDAVQSFFLTKAAVESLVVDLRHSRACHMKDEDREERG